MNVQLIWDQVVPVFLQNEALPPSEVWGQRFALQQGTSLLINAASGKGKSTMLGMLHGVRSIPQGDIQWNGRSLRAYTVDDWTRHRTAESSMMFQELRLFEALTVEENLKLSLKLFPEYMIETAEQMLGTLGLSGLFKRPLGTLSFGQRQRVALVRTLNRPFRLLLLDEPFSHLDTANQAQCLKMVLQVCEAQGASCILSTLGSNYGGDFHQTLHL